MSTAAETSGRWIARALFALVGAAVGCGGGTGDGTGPGTDANPGADAEPPLGSLLRIEIEADPGTGMFDGDFDPTLDFIEIVLTDFRAIGDAAPGDERTRLDNFTLRFDDGSELAEFTNAPIGVYSRLRARVDRFTTRGTCVINQENLEWEIDVEPPGGIELDISFAPTTLDPGGQATIEIEARLDRPYAEVDWSDLTPVAGVITVDDSFNDAAEIYSKIDEVFRYDD